MSHTAAEARALAVRTAVLRVTVPARLSNLYLHTPAGTLAIPSPADRSPDKPYYVAVYHAPGTPTGYEARIEETPC